MVIQPIPEGVVMVEEAHQKTEKVPVKQVLPEGGLLQIIRDALHVEAY
jgi:hypothetical protein